MTPREGLRTVGLSSPSQLYCLNRAGRLTIKPESKPIQKDEADQAIKQSIEEQGEVLAQPVKGSEGSQASDSDLSAH